MLKTDSDKMKKTDSIDEKAVENLDRIIFPDNKWIKTWDMLILFALFVLMFTLPYQIGVVSLICKAANELET